MTEAEIHRRPGEFRAALEFTAAETGFSSRLIEKDYWCSLILRELFLVESLPLVFKGGTLLSKGYADFDRLSEDLDFTLPTPAAMARSARSARAAAVEIEIDRTVRALGLRWGGPWTGHNQSSQHVGRLEYRSISGTSESILIEVGQREELLRDAAVAELRTLLMNPVHREAALPPIAARALSRPEAYAEKVRAALTRREPAIRDLYDFWRGLQGGFIPQDDPDWLTLTRRKCQGLDLADACSDNRFEQFRRGLATDLLPVLKSGTIDSFPFLEAWNRLRELHAKLLG